jgi:hypothetical protein
MCGLVCGPSGRGMEESSSVRTSSVSSRPRVSFVLRVFTFPSYGGGFRVSRGTPYSALIKICGLPCTLALGPFQYLQLWQLSTIHNQLRDGSKWQRLILQKVLRHLQNIDLLFRDSYTLGSFYGYLHKRDILDKRISCQKLV